MKAKADPLHNLALETLVANIEAQIACERRLRELQESAAVWREVAPPSAIAHVERILAGKPDLRLV